MVAEGEAGAAPGGGATVVRTLDPRLDDRLSARRVLEELEPELDLVDAAPLGDLVEEGLRRELVRDEADAAQRRGADAGRLPELLGEAVWEVGGADFRPRDREDVDPLQYPLVSDRVHVGGPPLPGDPVPP